MVKKVQLKNGMTVLKNLQKKSPVVSLQVWVDNGSANEIEDVAGVSHFIEHLLFKGTKEFGPGEIAKYIEGEGGQLNAYTSFDQTVYYMTLGASKLSSGLRALSDMIFFPLFEQNEVDREREVVIEEIRMGRDEPSRVNSQFAFKAYFKDHPYGRPIIGYDHVIESIPVEVIKTYFGEHYHPEKMFLLITGDFDESTIDEDVAKYFDNVSKTKARFNPLAEITNQNQKEFKFQKTNFEETVFNFYWPCANLNTKDYVCLEILALILGQGESSYLYKTLKLDNPVVKTIGCYAYSLKKPGIFAINFKPMSGLEAKSIQSFQEEFKKITNLGISESDFEKAIINFKSEIFYSMETCDGLARMVGQHYFYLKEENYIDKYLEVLDQIKLSDVEEMFQKYILNIPPKLYVSASKDENYVETIKQIFSGPFLEGLTLKKNEAKQVKIPLNWKKKKENISRICEFKLDQGTRVYIKAQNETPVIQMDMAFLGGEKIDPMGGIYSLLSQRSWGRETKDLSESELIFEFDKKASSHSIFSGKHSLGSQVSTLSSFFEDVLKLNFDLINHTEVSQKIIDRDHHLLKQYYENRKDNPVQVAFQEFMKQMFAGHYYQNDSLEKISSLENISSSDLSKYIQSHFDPSNLVVSIVGDVDVDQTLKWIESGLKGMTQTKQHIEFKSFAGLTDNKEKQINLDKEQAQIIFGFQGLRYSDSRRPILAVIQSILSGQGGRLFLELRDKASLAYTVSPIRMEGQEAGYFGSYIACAPTKKEKAISMMKEEFQKLVDIPVGIQELNAAKASLIGRAEIALQRNSEICEKILFDSLYGLPYNSYLNYANAIRNVTSDDVQRLMAELYGQPNVLVILG